MGGLHRLQKLCSVLQPSWSLTTKHLVLRLLQRSVLTWSQGCLDLMCDDAGADDDGGKKQVDQETKKCTFLLGDRFLWRGHFSKMLDWPICDSHVD